jgi:hypothetical protein
VPASYEWKVPQATRETLTIPVIDQDDNPVTVAGWAVDAVVKTQPGGVALHTFPADDITIAGSEITLVIPADTSAAWDWTRAWYRVKITDPVTVAVGEPNTQRVLQGHIVIHPD